MLFKIGNGERMMKKTAAIALQFRLHPLTVAVFMGIQCWGYSQFAHADQQIKAQVSADQQEQVSELQTITIFAESVDLHQKGKDEMFSKDISNLYADKAEVERYRFSSAADLLKGLNGVYSADARNAGALDPNIRGIQGEGRIPLTIDGTEQSTSVWMGPAGVANRNYIDPNMVSSILVEKGASTTPGLAGIGGSIQIKTLQVDDIVAAGESFGIELKTDTSTNSVQPNESAMHYFGQDYRDIPGATASNSSYGEVNIPGMRQLPRIGNSGKNFNFDDYSYRIAAATKQDAFDFLAAYSYRQRGNYFSGKNNSSKYQTDSWQEDAIGDTGAESATGRPSISYIAKYFLPGDEVVNTSSEQETTLLKATWRISDQQQIDLGYMRSEQSFGEQLPWAIAWAVHEGDGNRQSMTQFPYSEVKQDTWNLNYAWKPESQWIDFKAALWTTENHSARHQNGDLIYGIGLSWFDAKIDQAWERYTKCHVLQNSGIDCRQVPSTPPEKLPNEQGLYTVTARALQITDHRRTGFNLSNRFEINPRLDFTLAGDFTKEKLQQTDASEGHVLSELTWGVGHMGPRSGTRQQWNGSLNVDWRPTSWLQVNAGARYSDYWSFDEKLSENRRNQAKNWAVQPEVTGMFAHYRELLSEQGIQQLSNQFKGEYQNYIDWATDFMQQYPEAGDLLSDYLLENPTATGYADGIINGMKNEEGLIYTNYSNENTIPTGPANKYVVLPYNGNHKGFADANPFLNGQIDPNLIVEDAQGTGISAPKYIMGSTHVLYAPQSSVKDEWEQPKKQKDHAWVPYIGITASLSDHARIYVRYNEFVRYPSVFESSLALVGSNKRSTGVANQPEHAYNWEVGYVHNLTSFAIFQDLNYADFRLNYFNNRIEDYLDRDYNFNIVQFAEKKLSGIEVLARFDSGKYFTNLGATYRLNQEVCDKDYASYLDPIYNRISSCVDGGFPRTFARTGLQPKYSVNMDVGARLFDRKLELGGRAVYHSEAKNDSEAQFGQIGWAYNRAYYWNPILTLDAYMNYQINSNVRANFNITNLTNQYYLDPLARVSVPAPGRTMTAGFTVKF